MCVPVYGCVCVSTSVLMCTDDVCALVCLHACCLSCVHHVSRCVCLGTKVWEERSNFQHLCPCPQCGSAGVCCLVCRWVYVQGYLDPALAGCPWSWALQDSSVGTAELPMLRRAKVALFSEASTQMLQGRTWGLQRETLVLKPMNSPRDSGVFIFP